LSKAERLAALDESTEEDISSTQRLTRLAQKQKFAIAWGGLDAEAGRKLEISFTNLPAEAFDAVAWISSR